MFKIKGIVTSAPQNAKFKLNKESPNYAIEFDPCLQQAANVNLYHVTKLSLYLSLTFV